MKYYVLAFKKAIDFQGRANRPEFWSWPFEKNKEFGGLGGPQIKDEFELDFSYDKDTFINGNTTLNVVATNINLNRSQALRIAIMAQDGLARAIRPVHTPFDGDIVFVLSTSEKKLPNLSPHEITQTVSYTHLTLPTKA